MKIEKQSNLPVKERLQKTFEKIFWAGCALYVLILIMMLFVNFNYRKIIASAGTGNSNQGTLAMINMIQIIVLAVTIIVSGLLFAKVKKLPEFLANVLKQKVMDLNEKASKIADGDLEVKVELDENDEFYELGQSLNKMESTINEYIKDIQQVLMQISQGDLDIDMDQHIEYKGTFEKLRASIEEILFYLNYIFGEIQTATKEVSGGSGEVAQTAQTLSEGATDQAGSIDKLTNSISEINTGIQHTAKNAEETSKISNNLANKIDESGKNKPDA